MPQMNTYRTTQSLVTMIRRVQTARGRQRTGLFSVEGTRLVERAIRAGAQLEAVLVAESLAMSEESRHRDLLETLVDTGCRTVITRDELLIELTKGRDLGLILGLVRMPSPISLADLLRQDYAEDATAARQLSAPRPALLLAAVDIVDPGNVGALTRTAHAGGARALLAVGASDPFHPRATRISRGSIFKLPVISYADPASFIRDLRAHEVVMAGTAAGGGISLPRVSWPRRPTAILMGNEAEGLPAEVAAVLDFAVTIPMPEGVDSYSVNAAAAIVLYAAAQSPAN